MLNSLPADEVHLYWIDAIGIDHHYTAPYLNQAEQKRAASFKFDIDRQHYQAAHNWLRQLLSQYAPIHPSAWQFSQNNYGKPFITNAAYIDLHFNLSHTNGLIACAIRRDKPIGVDVERHKTIADLTALANYSFTASERDYVFANTDTQEQQQRFFTCWTLKEAYIKALGMGLSCPLQDFSIVCDQQGQWQLYTELPQDEISEQWFFTVQAVTQQHHLALAVPVVYNQPAPRVLLNPFYGKP